MTAIQPRCFERTLHGKAHRILVDDRDYFDATAMCASAGKRWNNFWQLAQTQAFVAELAATTGITVVALVRTDANMANGARHTWVHRRVAIHLGQWISPAFAVWVTDLVEQFLSGALAAPAPLGLESVTGFQDWTASQFYMAWIKGDSWDSLGFCDGSGALLAPGERCTIFVIKFGRQEEGARQTTHIREFGGDYELLDSFPTLFAPTVEARVKNWLRTRGLLMEGRHSKRNSRDTELIGAVTADVYAEVVAAVQRIVQEVETDMRTALGIAASTTEPVEVQVERIRQQGLTDRYREKQVTKRLRMQTSTQPPTSTDTTSRASPGAPPTQRESTQQDERKVTAATADIVVVAGAAGAEAEAEAEADAEAEAEAAGAPIVQEGAVSFVILAGRPDWRPVRQLDFHGAFVKDHPSASEAARIHKKFHTSDILKCVDGQRDLHMGFRWVEVPFEERETREVTAPYRADGNVVQKTMEGEFVNSYSSTAAAARAVKVKKGRIDRALSDRLPCQLHLWSQSHS